MRETRRRRVRGMLGAAFPESKLRFKQHRLRLTRGGAYSVRSACSRGHCVPARGRLRFAGGLFAHGDEHIQRVARTSRGNARGFAFRGVHPVAGGEARRAGPHVRSARHPGWRVRRHRGGGARPDLAHCHGPGRHRQSPRVSRARRDRRGGVLPVRLPPHGPHRPAQPRARARGDRVRRGPGERRRPTVHAPPLPRVRRPRRIRAASRRRGGDARTPRRPRPRGGIPRGGHLPLAHGHPRRRAEPGPASSDSRSDFRAASTDARVHRARDGREGSTRAT